MIEFRPLQPPLRHIASPPHRHIPATPPLRKMSAARHFATSPKFRYSATPLLHRLATPPNRHSSTRLSTTMPNSRNPLQLRHSSTPPHRQIFAARPFSTPPHSRYSATPPLHSFATTPLHSATMPLRNSANFLPLRHNATATPQLVSPPHCHMTCPPLCLATPSLRHSVRV